MYSATLQPLINTMIQIQGPSLTGQLALTNAQSIIGAWKLGQLLSANVLTATQGGLELRIGNTRVQAQTTLNAAPGQNLQLKVISAGEKPVLQVITTAKQPDTLPQTMRLLLPRQTGLPPLLANLSQLNQLAQSADGKQALPNNLLQLGQQIMKLLPGSDTVSRPTGLRQAILDSGVFMENKLAQAVQTGSRPQLDTDFKAGLLRLVRDLTGEQPKLLQTGAESKPASLPTSPQTAPPLRGAPVQPQASAEPSLQNNHATVVRDLVQQIESSLARVQLNQLASVPGEQTPTPLFTLELPVRRGNQADVFDLRIQRDAEGHDGEVEKWSVWLAFDFEGLGPVRTLISAHGNNVSVSLWAEQDHTAAAFDQNLGQLRANLDRAGLEVGRLASQPGKPHGPNPDRPQALVDTLA
ncbi:MAG TPA: hypothetical protein ENI80_02790 [Acidiferrobacteraceae bacterium]|nr:hypothetical protein [Acidiferrobacteraceae bacterium]